MQAGTAAGRVWLAATAYGLGACASAGFIEPGLRHLVELDGYRSCPLFAISLGYPASEDSDGIENA
ncbi:MAG: hypothetical protein GEU75_15365 [Dehalococcoidia bacterium]|nr:hypothetical protein [Dehalococcoidia bacterium]